MGMRSVGAKRNETNVLTSVSSHDARAGLGWPGLDSRGILARLTTTNEPPCKLPATKGRSPKLGLGVSDSGETGPSRFILPICIPMDQTAGRVGAAPVIRLARDMQGLAGPMPRDAVGRRLMSWPPSYYSYPRSQPNGRSAQSRPGSTRYVIISAMEAATGKLRKCRQLIRAGRRATRIVNSDQLRSTSGVVGWSCKSQKVFVLASKATMASTPHDSRD